MPSLGDRLPGEGDKDNAALKQSFSSAHSVDFDGKPGMVPRSCHIYATKGSDFKKQHLFLTRPSKSKPEDKGEGGYPRIYAFTAPFAERSLGTAPSLNRSAQKTWILFKSYMQKVKKKPDKKS